MPNLSRSTIDQQMERVGLLGTSIQLKYHQEWLANLQNQPYLMYNHQPGVPPPTVLMAPMRCDYCRMSDFANSQCQRCGAPQR